MEVFERAVAAGARLLKADRSPAPGGDEERWVSGLLLTFDVGRIHVDADVAAGAIVASQLDLDEVPPGFWVAADEEEPWWKLRGNPLTRFRAEGPALALQFRADDENPRVVELAVEEGLVRISVEPGRLAD